MIGHFLHHTWPEHSYTPLDASKPQTYILFIYMLSDTSSRYLRTNQDNNRHHQTPTDTKRHQQTSPDTQKGRSRIVLTWNGVCWCLLVSYVVWRCEEGVWGVFQSVSECCFKHNMDVCTVSLRLRVYLSVMALYGAANAHIGKSPKGKIPHTWHFWNIKIPKPPYVSSLKIIGLLHPFIFLGPSKENYNLQSLWITL